MAFLGLGSKGLRRVNDRHLHFQGHSADTSPNLIDECPTIRKIKVSCMTFVIDSSVGNANPYATARACFTQGGESQITLVMAEVSCHGRKKTGITTSIHRLQLNLSFHPYSEVCQRIFVGCGHLQLALVTVALLHVGAGGAGGAVDAGTLTPGDALPVQ